MKVLILGGTRYVGMGLARKMRANKKFEEVYTLSRQSIKDNLNHVTMERTNVKALEKIFYELRPNLVIDFICFTKKDSETILYLKKKGLLASVKHYVVISSFFVYNYYDLNDYREKKLNKNNFLKKINDTYTKNKIEMEIVLNSRDLKEILSIIRLPYIFSWDDYTNRFQSICKIAWFYKLNVSKNNFRFSMISKNSAVDGILYLSQTNPLGIIDLANPGCLDLAKLCEIINNAKKNKSKKKSFIPSTSPYILKKSICIETKKIPLNKTLSEAINEEADIYLKKYF